VVTLPDGRRLSWYEFGDPDGSPVIYTAGTPVSGLGGGCYDQTARAAGLRWISPDKSGYGRSDYHRERSLIGWGADLGALAGHLGLASSRWRVSPAARHSRWQLRISSPAG
jgi:pimeloyl-ACP methyl ester carboxylesterase